MNTENDTSQPEQLASFGELRASTCSPFESDPVTLLMKDLIRETFLGSPTISAEEMRLIESMIRDAWPDPQKAEGYPEHYLHATIHVDPDSGHMTSDGDHEVRHWLQSRMVREGNLSLLAKNHE